MKPLRVLVVTQYYWPETFPINDFVGRLLASGVEVEVLTAKPNYSRGHFFEGFGYFSKVKDSVHDSPVFRVPIFPRGRATRLALLLNYLSFVVSACLLGPWFLRKREYDVVFAYLPSPVLAAIPAVLMSRVKKARLIYWVQDLWPESVEAVGRIRNKVVLRGLSRLVKWLYEKADRIAVSSSAFIPPILEVMGREDSGCDKLYYLPNTFATSDAQPSEVVDLEQNGKFRLIFAGNVGRAQCVGVLVEAAHLLRHRTDIEFVVVGVGSALSELQAQASEHGLTNIEFIGQYPVDSMPSILGQASALLLTLCGGSVLEFTVPSKLQAYLAVGKPIVAAINGETGRVIQDAQAGMVTPAENAHALAEAIEELSQMPEEQRQLMGENAKRYYSENFDPDVLNEKVISILESSAG